MSIADKVGTAAKLVVAPQAIATEMAIDRVTKPPKPPRKVHLHLRWWVPVVVVALAVWGLNSVFGFLKVPSLPSPISAEQVSPPVLDPILVEPTQTINLNESIIRRYPINYASAEMCTTFLGACTPGSKSHKDIRAVGVTHWYVQDNVTPADIDVVVTQAIGTTHGLIAYTVTVAAPYSGPANLEEKTVHIGEYVEALGHTTPIPTDQEMRNTAISETEAAAQADTVAVTEAENVAGDSLKNKITAFVQPVLDALSAKKLLNGSYDIRVTFNWQP